MTTADQHPTPARRLAAALEPVAGQVHFSPECHANYAALGFGPSSGRVGLTELPDRTAYFTSRGSVMGQVSGQVVAAAFAVFNPTEVIPHVRRGWELTDATTMCAARHDGAVAQLRRILGAEPAGVGPIADLLTRAIEPLASAGRPLFAGQLSLESPADPLGRLWWAANTLREFRGDSHTIAWTAAGFDATETGLLGDLYWGLAPRAHTAGRGWTADQMAAAEDRLASRGLIDGDRISTAGRAAREAVEAHTDDQVAPALAVLGDRLDHLAVTLQPWGDAIRAAGGYLTPAVRFTAP